MKMVRTYKGQKRKTKKEKYDSGEESGLLNEEESPQLPKKQKTEPQLPKKQKTEAVESNGENLIDEMPGIPIVPVESENKPGVIFILEKASLEIAKVGKSFQLLSSDEHANYLLKNKRNPAEYRPDIAFQAIQTILDSRVNKVGRLKALYVKTQEGILFQIKPHARMPRTYKRFSGLMVQLLQKLHITAAGKGEKLLRVIKNPVTQYLPIKSRKIGFSHSSEKLVNIHDYVGTVNRELDLVFVVGAMAHGKIDKDYVEDYISISSFPLSAAYCISMITTSLEQKWEIL